MSALFPDIHPKAEAVLIQLLREAPSWRKMEKVGQLNQSVRQLVWMGLTMRYPEDSQDKPKLRLAKLLFGERLARKERSND